MLDFPCRNIDLLITDKLPIFYSNYSLGKPLDEPTFMEVFACCSIIKNNISYYVVGTSENPSYMNPRIIRSKILGYSVRDEITKKQKELCDKWHRNPKSAQEIMISAIADHVHAYNVPLTFIAFGHTREKNVPTSHIFHPPSLPTFVFLDLLKTSANSKALISKN